MAKMSTSYCSLALLAAVALCLSFTLQPVAADPPAGKGWKKNDFPGNGGGDPGNSGASNPGNSGASNPGNSGSNAGNGNGRGSDTCLAGGQYYPGNTGYCPAGTVTCKYDNCGGSCSSPAGCPAFDKAISGAAAGLTSFTVIISCLEVYVKAGPGYCKYGGGGQVYTPTIFGSSSTRGLSHVTICWRPPVTVTPLPSPPVVVPSPPVVVPSPPVVVPSPPVVVPSPPVVTNPSPPPVVIITPPVTPPPVTIIVVVCPKCVYVPPPKPQPKPACKLDISSKASTSAYLLYVSAACSGVLGAIYHPYQAVCVIPAAAGTADMQTNLALLNKVATGDFTLFAPTDKAWRKFFKKCRCGGVEAFLKHPAGYAYATEILKSLIVPKVAAPYTNLIDGDWAQLRTVSSYVSVSYKKQCTIRGLYGVATVVSYDYSACRGIIHLVDSVLQPRRTYPVCGKPNKMWG